MTPQIERAATQAIFHLQLNTGSAIRHVCKVTGVESDVATQALRAVMTFHRRVK
jgi:hypothetical protein